MMKHIQNGLKLACFMVILIGLVGCSYVRKTSPGAPIWPGLKINVERDAEVIDIVEGYGEQTTILWFIKLGDKNYGAVTAISAGGKSAGEGTLSLSALLMGPKRDATGAAIYSCIEDAWSKGADLILPMATTTEVKDYFVYKKEKAHVKAKALKIEK